jgi:hypothetical protein
MTTQMEQFIKLLKDVEDAARLHIDPEYANMELAERNILDFVAKHLTKPDQYIGNPT